MYGSLAEYAFCRRQRSSIAEQTLKKIVGTYLEPNKTIPQLRAMFNSGMIDPLRIFSEAVP